MYIEKVEHNGKVHIGVSTIDTSLPVDALLPAAQAQLGRAIDAAAGKARQAFVSNGELVAQEYQLAKQEAADWLANGKDETAIPSSVADHVAMTGQSTEEAAQEIVATAELWEQALSGIRSLRLGGKTAVRNADTIKGAEQAANEAIAQLKAYRP